MMITILFCADIEKSKAFYEKYEGFSFKHEKHANGPEHYFGKSPSGFYMELYPAQNTDGRRAGQMTLLFDAPTEGSSNRSTVIDPDGRKVILNHAA